MLIFLVWASADIDSNVYLKSLCKGKTDAKIVTLTFDDGPDEIMTPRVLDILKEYDIKATFCLIGSKAEQNYALVRRIVAEGHTVANHTYSHSWNFPMSSAAQVERELIRCNDAIFAATGVKTKYFRPPFGVTNPIVGKMVKKMKFNTIGWSIRSLDTIQSRDRERVCSRIINRLHPGAIILLHDRCNDADLLLEMLIAKITSNGYRIVSLTELSNIEPYEN